MSTVDNITVLFYVVNVSNVLLASVAFNDMKKLTNITQFTRNVFRSYSVILIVNQ